MALEGDSYNRDSVSSSMSQVISSLDTLAPNALNLFVSDLYLRRNAVPGLAAEAVEHQ